MPFEWSELRHLLTQAIGFPGKPRARRGRRARAPAWPIRRGTLALVAGTLDDELAVELIRRAGGRRSRTIVLPTGHLDWARAGERYARYFSRFGMQRVEVADLVTRQRCTDRVWCGRLQDADLVCVGGGDAGLLLRIASGTPAERSLATGLSRGTVVVFCGGVAGAAGSAAIDWGAIPGRAAVRPGLGLLPDSLVDGQAVRRGQLGRLFAAVGTDLLAICLDDATTLLCGPGPEARVYGRGAALLIDGRQGGTDAAMTGVVTRLLEAGWRIDLAQRLVLPPPPPAPGRRSGAAQDKA